MAVNVRRLLLGKRLQTEDLPHQSISKKVGLAVFASDALSSTAYATEEILVILSMAVGGGAAAWAGRDGTILGLVDPDRHRYRHSAGDCDHLLSPDDLRLSERRRRVHRRARQSRRNSGADRGRGAADRLHPDGRREYLVRCRADHVGVSGAAALARRDGGRRHRAC